MKQNLHRKHTADPTAVAGSIAPEKLNPLDVAGKLYNKGQLDKAHQLCLRLLASQPADHKALLLLAMIEGRRGNSAKAIDLAKHAIRLNPTYPDAYINLGIMYRDHHILSLAEKLVAQGLQIDPDHRLGLLILATLQQDKRDWLSAEQTMRRLVQLQPSEPESHYRLGDLLSRQGRHGEAEDAFRAALAINPKLVKAHCGLSRVHPFSPGDPELGAMQKCLADPKLSIKERVLLNFGLGWGHDRIGAFADAFGYLSEANRLQANINPFDEKSHLRYLSRIRAGYGQPDPRPRLSVTALTSVPVFIIGPSRSGKTLYESLLARDKRVLPLGEGKEFLMAMDEVIERHHLQDSFPECLGRLTSEQLHELGSAYRHRISAIDPTAKYSVNTLPGHYKFVGLILDALPEARVIYSRRGTLDTCLRIYSTNYKHPHSYSHDQVTLARYYAAYWHLLEFWRGKYGERILQMNYEDLVADPTVAIDEMLDIIGMDKPTAWDAFKILPGEVGHWRHYANELRPMRETLHEMALAYEIPDLLRPEDHEDEAPLRSVLEIEFADGIDI